MLAALAAAIPALAVVLVIGVFALMGAFVWALLRLSLVSAVVVAENNLGVERSWELTKGNALRMLGVLLVTWLPYMVVASLVALRADRQRSSGVACVPVGRGRRRREGCKEAFAKAMKHWQIGLMKAMRAHWVEFSVVGFIGNLISTALDGRRDRQRLHRGRRRAQVIRS